MKVSQNDGKSINTSTDDDTDRRHVLRDTRAWNVPARVVFFVQCSALMRIKRIISS